MAIPDLDEHGLLPVGAHDCSAEEIAGRFGWNPHRLDLTRRFSDCLVREVRSRFSEPVYVNGSFVTDKETPEDVDAVLDVRRATDSRQLRAIKFMAAERDRLRRQYSVDFWVNLPGANDFSDFFQYLGVKTARYKGLDAMHRKGILRIR
jgi:hypothetical protein